VTSPDAARSLFAITAPGLEAVTAGELRALGMRPARAEPGGVTFRGGMPELQRANLWLRTASRVVVRIASFEATAFHELERRARRVDWGRYLSTPARVRFRVTCRKSRLYHSDAVAARLAEAIARGPGLANEPEVIGGEADDDAETPAQLFIVRLLHDRVTISADSSGALLHRRGYRQATGRAPLRETLAAAMVLASEWDPATPLADPMCGAGTIVIEAARLARGMAPGLDYERAIPRAFAFTHWPEHDEPTWHDEWTSALARSRRVAGAPILAADRDAGAIASATSNAARAGVAASIELVQQPISALDLPSGPGHVVTNPPYGVRVGERASLRDLYARFGAVVRARAPEWTVAFLSADRALERQTGLVLEELFRTSNGGIPVRLVRTPGRVSSDAP
jgi:putative N6-adenine-specific DNA methylase